MCQTCEECDGEFYCQDCGRMICFDFAGEDDVTAPAYVTESGDLFCRRCGIQYDREDNETYGDDAWDYYPSDWYDAKSDLDQLEDADTPRTINIKDQAAGDIPF